MALDFSFPRRIKFETYLSGDWRDLSTDVRQKPAITITRGRKDEAGKPAPALCKLTLDDTSHNYSPTDPLGVYFGNSFLNAPARFALILGTDDFARTVASGWGNSPTNGAYSTGNNGTTTSSVSGGEGRHGITSLSTYQRNTLSDIAARNMEVRVSVTIDSVASVTGGSLEPANIMLRTQAGFTDHYLCRMTVTSTNQVQLKIMYRDTTDISDTITLPTAYSGQKWRVAAAIEDRTIRFKAWPAASAEPLGWHVTCDTVPEILGPGWPGVRSGVGAGNSNAKPVLFRYDDLEIRSNRHYGEVSSWDPDRDLGEKNRTVAVEVSSVAQRLGQFKKKLRGASYRFITTATNMTVTDYWPFEDEPNATNLGYSWTGGSPPEFVQWLDENDQLQGAIKWGQQATLLGGVERAVELINAGELHCHVASGLTDKWTVSWAQRISQASGGQVRLRSAIAADDIILTFFTNGNYLVQVGTGITFTTIFSGSLANPGYDDVWHTFSVTAWDSGGGGCTYRLAIDGNGPASTGLSPVTFSELRSVEFVGGDIHTTLPCAFSQLVVSHDDNGTNNIPATLYVAAFGYNQEFALQRAQRLGLEQGVPVEVYSDPFTLSAPMGPQGVGTLLQLFDDAVTADRGSRYDPKGANALGFRTVRSMLGQTPAVTLDYSGGYVMRPFQPRTDQQGLVNQFTAKRPNGGQFVYERTVGPKNSNDPGTVPGAVGLSDASGELNVSTDGFLAEMAAWRVNVGTVDKPRYPTIGVDLTSPFMTAALASLLMDVAIEDLMTVTGASEAGVYDDVRCLVRGYTEVLDTQRVHRMVFNASPAEPYDPVVLDAATAVLAGSTDTGNPSTLTAGISNSAGTCSVASTGYLWLTGAQSTPAMLNGERVTITNITGATSPQTFTITRSVNGVVKAHLAGAPIEVFAPVRLAPWPA
jgi:hypothetical protein